MDIGVGLPTTIPGIEGRQLLDWACQAEQLGFSTLGVLDRLVYANYEPIVALAGAAAVTQRIRLATTILIAPYRGSATLLAKELATLDHLSGGRLMVGVAAGGRADDYVAAGMPYAGRGRLLDEQLATMRRIWASDGTPCPIGPRPPRGEPVLLIGGHSTAALRRAARFGRGWIAGAGSSTPVTERLRRVRATWSAAGRSDEPLLLALAYFALGPRARECAERYLRHYYAFLGRTAQDQVMAGVLTDEQGLRDAIREYTEAGCHEMILFPCVAEQEQANLLAKAVLEA